jgi:hypothetical protein
MNGLFGDTAEPTLLTQLRHTDIGTCARTVGKWAILLAAKIGKVLKCFDAR